MDASSYPGGAAQARRALAVIAAVLLVGAAPAGAQAPQMVTLHPTAGYTGQLGVDARGGAVVAWSEFLKPRFVYSVLVRVRRPGGAFGAARRLSSSEVEGTYALAVGARGDAVLAWRQIVAGGPRVRSLSQGPDPREVLLSRARPGGRFGAPLRITARGFAVQISAAVDGRGRVLVAWLQSAGRKGCGRVVMATVVSAAGRLAAVRRVSAACPSAELLRVALARNGSGAISWRAGRASEAGTRYSVQVVTYAGGRFAAPRTVSHGRVWYGRPALAAGGSRALVAWRALASTTRAGLARGRVVTATIDGAHIGPRTPISTSDELEGDVYAAMSPADGAIVSWTQLPTGDVGNRVAVRAAGSDRFAAPEAISSCAPGVSAGGAGRDNLDTAAHAAIDAGGRAIAIFGNGCGGGVAAARRPAGGQWAPAFAISAAANNRDASRLLSVATSDAGEAVALWWDQKPDAPFFDAAQLNAAILPAP